VRQPSGTIPPARRRAITDTLKEALAQAIVQIESTLSPGRSPAACSRKNQEAAAEAFERWKASVGASSPDPRQEFSAQTACVGVIQVLLDRLCARAGLNGNAIHGNFWAGTSEVRRTKRGSIPPLESLFSWYRPAGLSLRCARELADGHDLLRLDFDPFGPAYEAHVGRRERRRRGQYYTPSELVRCVLDSAGYGGARVLHATLLDPACGSGSFLVEAAHRLKEACVEASANAADAVGSIQRALYGLDSDPFACYLTRVNLFLQVLGLVADLDDDSAPLPCFNVRCADALVDEDLLHPCNAPVGSGTSSPARMVRSFDFVVGNPPFGRFQGDEHVLSRYRNVASGPVNAATLFVRNGVERLKRSGGRLAFVLPKSFTYIESFRKIRDFLKRSGRVASIADLGIAFQDVGLEQCVLVVERGRHTERVEVHTAFELSSEHGPPRPAQPRSHRIHSVTTDAFHTHKRFPMYVDDVIHARLGAYRDRARFVPLGGIADIFRGVAIQGVTEGQAERVTPECPGRLITGREVERYYVRRFRGIDPEHERFAPMRDRLRRMAVPGKIAVQRLVSSKVRIVACLCREAVYAWDTITNVVLRDPGFDPPYVLALLNSRFMTTFLKYFVFNNATLSMDMDRPYLGDLPVAGSDERSRARIARLANEALERQERLNDYRRRGCVVEEGSPVVVPITLCLEGVKTLTLDEAIRSGIVGVSGDPGVSPLYGRRRDDVVCLRRRPPLELRAKRPELLRYLGLCFETEKGVIDGEPFEHVARMLPLPSTVELVRRVIEFHSEMTDRLNRDVAAFEKIDRAIDEEVFDLYEWRLTDSEVLDTLRAARPPRGGSA